MHRQRSSVWLALGYPRNSFNASLLLYGTTRHQMTVHNQHQVTLFYDGDCALCHGTVLFVLARDQQAVFRFAPLAGRRFAELRSSFALEGTLPDSIVLSEGPKQPLLFESDAALRVLVLLGGLWRVFGISLRVVPRSLRDAAYRFIAQRRKRWFGKAEGVCPIMPPHYRSRFDLDIEPHGEK